MPTPKKYSITGKYVAKYIMVLTACKSIFGGEYFAFYNEPFFDDNCNQNPIPDSKIKSMRGYCNTENIIVYTENRTGIMIYKG